MGTYRKHSQIDTVIIHCTDTPNGRKNTIEDVDQWHKEKKFKRDLSLAPKHQPHLKHVGYHFVIEIDGAVRVGRPLHETGAHVEGHNTKTIGIALMGRDQFTPEQWAALKALVESLNQAKVFGHCRFNAGKTCPGFDVLQWLASGYQPHPDHILEAA